MDNQTPSNLDKLVDYVTNIKPRNLIIIWFLFLTSIGVNVGGLTGFIPPFMVTEVIAPVIPKAGLASVTRTTHEYAKKKHKHSEYSHTHIDFNSIITKEIKAENTKRIEADIAHVNEFHKHR